MSRTLAAIGIAPATSLANGAEIRLLPPSARLDGPRASQRFVVELRDGDAWTGDRTAEAALAVDNPRIATIAADGTVTPVGNGLARVSARVGDEVAEAWISVEDHEREDPWSFRNHVLAVLTKAGCNSGACHGAAAGTPPPRDDDARVVAFEVRPDAVRLRRGDAQRLLVQARYSDGHVEDVTRWAKFASTDDAVARVDEAVDVRVLGLGEAAATEHSSAPIELTVAVEAGPIAVPSPALHP